MAVWQSVVCEVICKKVELISSMMLQLKKIKSRMFYKRIVSFILLIGVLGVTATLVKGQNIKLNVSGIPYSINGQDSVPVGLFGVHSTTLTPERVLDWGIEMVRGIEAGPSGSPSFPGKNEIFPTGIKMTIDCYYDRYQPALYLSNRSGWKAQLENLATTYANNSLTMSHKPIMEFWNEPFLNWASKPAANYDNRWYDTTEAVQGGPVRRPGFSSPEKHLIWDKRKWFVQLSPTVTDPVNFYVQLGNNWTALNNLAVGSELQIGSRRFKAVLAWLAKDTNQFSFYSSLANAEMYIKMYKAYSQKLKSINPDLKVLAGWGMSFSNDNWRPWRTIYKSTMDSCWQWMDGVHEHHYGGDTRFMTGAYEVVNAYGRIKYGKNFPIYNTEAGGFTDPQIPGTTTPGAPSDPLLRDRGAFQFTFREIVFNISRSADKLKSRAAHEAHFNNGDGMAFRLLRDLRGKLISATSTSDNVWCVSALNGNKLVVAVYNDLNLAQSINLAIKAPTGFQFTGGERKWVEDSSAGNTIVGRREVIIAGGSDWNQTINMALKSGTVLSFDLTGSLQAQSMQIEQYFADTILAKIPANGSLSTKILIPANDLTNITASRLKIYVRNYTGGTLTFNGQSFTGLQSGFFTYLNVAQGSLSEINNIIMSSNGTAFDLNFASLEIIKGNLDSALLTEVAPQVIQDESSVLNVYPNPVKNAFQVDFKGNAPKTYYLMDGMGKICKVGLIYSGQSIDVAKLPPGFYGLSINNKIQRIIKLDSE